MMQEADNIIQKLLTLIYVCKEKTEGGIKQ